MITFKEIGHHGRLGNQLFQIALLKVISIKTGYDIILPEDVDDRSHHGQDCLLNNFKFKTIKYGNPIVNYQYNEKCDWYYDDGIFSIPDNTNFFGYFQNSKYYLEFQNDLISEFKLNDDIESKIKSIFKGYTNNIVSLHIRRGDFTDGSIPELSKWGNDISENSIIINYYKTALSLIPKNSTVFLFTGGSRFNDNRSDIEWCKNNFKDDRIIFVDFLSDIECFAMMKSCDYNITSFISSFSWWSSFLNEKRNIIAPLNFCPHGNIAIDDYYPKYWKLI